MSKTIERLKNYLPYNEQEKVDKQYMIDCERVFGDILHRSNLMCHLTSAGIVINKERTKCLCVYHNLYKSWTFPGGHADGDDDMIYVAEKELMEETSLKDFRLLSQEPISIDTLTTDSHTKNGAYVPSHIHLSFAYLFEADENQSMKVCENENSDVRWLTFDELLENSNEPNMIKVFKKIFDRIKKDFSYKI